MSRRVDFTLTDEQQADAEQAINQYGPFLNPIERFWLHFKQLVVANRFHRSLKALQDSVDEVMTHQNTLQHPNRLILLDKFRLMAQRRAMISRDCS